LAAATAASHNSSETRKARGRSGTTQYIQEASPIAVSSKVYGLALQSLVNAEIDFDTATVKAMLTTSSYVPDQVNHRYVSSVTNEVTGTGYTAGGVTLTTKVVTFDPVTFTVTLDADDPSWTAATFTARYLVFYVDTGTAATSPLLSFVDFGANVPVSASTFTYQVPAGGFFQLTAAA
jgi:hypothetical protein